MNIRHALVTYTLLCVVPSFACGDGLDAYLITLLDIQSDEKLRLEREIDAGLLQIETVIKYPESSRYNHLGWPVATSTQSGGVVLSYKRSIAHDSDGSSSWEGRYVTRSTNMRDWNPPSPARRRGKVGGLSGMHAIAAPAGDIDTRVVLLADRTCFLSNDSGGTWVDNSSNMPDLGNAVHIGPNLVSHPYFGLLGFYGQEQGSSRRNWVVSSQDQGNTWSSHFWRNEENARGVEPAAAVFGDGHVILVSRERKAFGTSDGRYLCNTQHVYRHDRASTFDSMQFDTKRTNIRYNSALGVDSADTADVIFNPVSKRVEVIQSHRGGGGLGATGSTLLPPESRVHSLNVWSISPAELLAGSSTYRFDGTLLTRRGYSRIGDKDSFHPGGSVIDVDNGWHHIFVYVGVRRSPSAIVRISRVLDTERWRGNGG